MITVISETAPLPTEPPAQFAQETTAPVTGTDTADPAITVMAANALAAKQSDSDKTAIPMSAVFHSEVWEAEPQVVPEKEPETMQQFRKELTEAKEYAVAAEKSSTELGLLRKNREAETRCREFADKWKAREDEANGLRNSVHSLEAQIGELKSALAAKTEECRVIGESKGTEVAALTEKIQTLERQAGDMSFLMAARTGEFRGVLQRKDEEVESLRGKIQGLEKQTGELSSALMSKTREYRDLRASKDADADALLKQVLDLESKGKALEAALEEKEASFQSDLSGKDEEIRLLQVRIGEGEEQSFNMAVMVKGWEDRMRDVTEKEGQLKALYDLLELDLKKEIDAHQKLLASLRRQLQAA